MKFKKLIGKITAFILAGAMMFSSIPVYADTAANSGADVFATQSSNFTIRIPKQLVLSGDEGTGAYRVAVKGNISGTDIITVTPDAEFYMKQEGKSDILATITQPKTDFTYADGVRPETEVTSDGVIEMASISAGKWSGLFNFTVTSSVDLSLENSVGSNEADINGNVVGGDVSQDKHSEYDVITSETRTPIKVTATNSDGVDINASASAIVGKEAKDLLDKLNESGLIEDTEEVDALIEVKSDDFEGIADTTFDVSDIANPGDTVVILHFDEEKQMWEHIGTETVDESGKVNGDFTSYSPVAFVKVNSNGTLTTHYHNLEEHIQDPTCTQDGIKTYTCKDYCGYITTEFIDPLGHDYKTSSTASSCTEEGYTTYTCERCGDSYIDDKVPALGHSYGDWVTVKEPTCTETGSKQKTCSVCGDVVTESVNALGHSWNSDYTVDKEATCTVTGSKSIHCSVCNATKDTTTIPVKEHSYGNWTTVKEPTCTETGSKQKTCSACGDVVTESIDVLGHDYKSSSTAATCTNGGYITYTCNRCNNSYVENKAPATGHSYSNWVTVKEATCTEAGSKQKTCSACGDVVTESVNALGHSWNSDYTVDKEATCTVTGSKSIHCSVCNVTKDITTIPVKGHTSVIGGSADVHSKCATCGITLSSEHTYTKSVTTEATCTVKGTSKYTCTCGYNYTTQDIDTVAHNYQVVDIIEEISWKNTSNGTYAFIQDGTKWTSNNKGINSSTATSTWTINLSKQTNYSFNYRVSSESKYDKLTITLDGSTVVNAISGNGTEQVYTTTLSAGAHTITATYSKDSSSSTNEDRGYIILNNVQDEKSIHKCTICEIEEAHLYGKVTVKEPNCTETGSKQKTCSVCGYTYTETIPSSHDIVAGECTKCDYNIPGLYDANGTMLVAWEKCGLNIEKDYSYSPVSDATAPYKTISSYYPKTTKIIIPSNITNIGSNIFAECTSLTDIIIPSSVTRIGNSTFRNCKGLKNITIPSSVTSIGSGAFFGCISLTRITIPEGVTNIEDNTFYNCKSLTSIIIPENVTSIDNYAFDSCTSLASITILEGVTSIGNYAFDSCTSLASITIPEGATSIGNYAFYDCTGLTSITIPESVTSIGINAFKNTAWLKTKQQENPLVIVNGILVDGTTAKDNITIPNTVTTINTYAFYNCANLTNITIPASVTNIGTYAFSGCSNLTHVTIPDSVTNISDGTFELCTKLTSVTIPDSVTNIGTAAFSNTALTSVTIPSGVIIIGPGAFYRCSELINITIPSSVTSIGYSAFESCTKLISISIPFGVTIINNKTFKYCEGLTSVTIPSSITSIGNDAFNFCTNLTDITIPEKVTRIGYNAFSNCNKLTSINIPKDVTSIGVNAFFSTNLTSATFEDTTGWYRGSEEGAKTTAISSSYLSKTATAAEYLKSTYRQYYWSK